MSPKKSIENGKIIKYNTGKIMCHNLNEHVDLNVPNESHCI